MNSTAKGRNRKKEFFAKDWAGTGPFSSYNNTKKAFVSFQTFKSKRLLQDKNGSGKQSLPLTLNLHSKTNFKAKKF